MSLQKNSLHPDWRKLNQQKGRILEVFIHNCLLFLGIDHGHNNFDDYASSQGKVDLWIKGYRMYLECKNLSGFYKVGPRWVWNHIITRFPNRRGITKVLVISTLEALTPEAQALLKLYHITVIEAGGFVDDEDPWEVVIPQLVPLFSELSSSHPKPSNDYLDVFLRPLASDLACLLVSVVAFFHPADPCLMDDSMDDAFKEAYWL